MNRVEVLRRTPAPVGVCYCVHGFGAKQLLFALMNAAQTFVIVSFKGRVIDRCL